MTRQSGAVRTFEARMLALTDEVFQEFDDLPVLTVMRAITSSWSELRSAPATPRSAPANRPRPEEIVSLARHKLNSVPDARRSQLAEVQAAAATNVDGALLDQDHRILAQTSVR